MSLAQRATADEPGSGDGWTRPTELIDMPPGEWVTVEGEKLRCYSQPEGKEIALVLNQRKDLFLAAIRWELERFEFQAKIGGLELRLDAQLGLVQEHKNNSEYYMGLWKSTRVELHATHNRDKWRWLPWVLPTIMGIAWGISSSIN